MSTPKSQSTPKSESTNAVTLASWKRSAQHYPLCPSGVRVGIRIPDLSEMIETGQVPNHLIDAALGNAFKDLKEGETPSQEDIKKSLAVDREFTDLMLLKTVVEPKLTEADLRDIPTEDRDFLVAIATRARDVDAEGEHLGGLSSSEKFRKFRGIGDFDSSLEDL